MPLANFSYGIVLQRYPELNNQFTCRLSMSRACGVQYSSRYSGGVPHFHETVASARIQEPNLLSDTETYAGYLARKSGIASASWNLTMHQGTLSSCLNYLETLLRTSSHALVGAAAAAAAAAPTTVTGYNERTHREACSSDPEEARRRRHIDCPAHNGTSGAWLVAASGADGAIGN